MGVFRRDAFTSTILIALVILWTRSVPLNAAIDRCKPLTEGPLTKYCSGKYPSEIYTKYDDNFVFVGHPYNIYMVNNEPNRFFVSFDRWVVPPCNVLRFQSSSNLQCESTGKRLPLDFNRVYCFQTNLQIVDDLLRYCDKKVTTKNVFAALQYTTRNTYASRSGGLRFSLHLVLALAAGTTLLYSLES